MKLFEKYVLQIGPSYPYYKVQQVSHHITMGNNNSWRNLPLQGMLDTEISEKTMSDAGEQIRDLFLL